MTKVDGNLPTTVSVTAGLHQLWCEDCDVLLSVAHPAGFRSWLYPHPDHDTHRLHHIVPVDAAIGAELDLPEPTEPQRRKTIPCGTPRGYRAHRRHGEVPCDACRAAHTADAVARKRAHRERGQVRFTCETCGSGFDEAKELVVHLWLRHKRTITDIERRPARTKDTAAS